MLRMVLAGVAMAAACSGAAVAAGPISVETPFPAPIAPEEPFKANLESIGVGVELANPVFVDVFSPTDLTFRLLESRRDGQIISLFVGGVEHEFGLQAFTDPGTFLGTHEFSGSFASNLSFLAAFDPEGVPITYPDGFRVFIRTEDEDEFTGIGPFIGSVDTLYFSIGDAALFEVTSAAVPEPRTWALMIGGFLLAGAALRRRSRAAAAGLA